jgi:hypothetical protein
MARRTNGGATSRDMRSITKTLAAAAALALCAGARAAGPADRVLILANSESPDSVAIAQYYSEVSKVPIANVITLKMPLVETITWRVCGAGVAAAGGRARAARLD